MDFHHHPHFLLSYKFFLLLLFKAEISTVNFGTARVRAKLHFLEAFLVISSYQLAGWVVRVKWKGPEKHSVRAGGRRPFCPF